MDQHGLSGERVAFFGGSFDPPHLGHLAIARAAEISLGLDTVLFAPVGYQPLKPAGSMASFADRMAMTELAIADEPGFEVSAIDAPQGDGGPNYTYDTLVNLRGQLKRDGTLFFLMGADSFLNLRNWHRAPEIPFLAPLIVASRPRESLGDLRAALPKGLGVEPMRGAKQNDGGTPGAAVEVTNLLLRNDAGQTTPFYLLPGLHEDISASQIRASLHVTKASRQEWPEGPLTAKTLLPEAVVAYIEAHGLYRSANS